MIEKKVGSKVMRLIRGDITERDVDAIVNAANSMLQHGGGVALAIVRKGGQIIQQKSNKIGHVPTGGAAITTGGKLKARYVIHTVGPKMGEGDEDKKLISAVKSVLELASANALKSISMPAISAGIYGFPKDRCAEILVGKTSEFLQSHPESSLEVVEFCLFDEGMFKHFQRAMFKPSDPDIGILRKAGVSEEDIAHCVKVAEKAIEIAFRTGVDMDLELVGRGALFHDLGKARTHGMEHGKIGAEIGRTIGLPDSITAIMEKHIRGGLTADEARELNLPVKDYTLTSIEEKIVIYADRLVDIITDGIVKINSGGEAEDRFEDILKGEPKYGKNEITLQRYLGYHREIQGLIKSGASL